MTDSESELTPPLKAESRPLALLNRSLIATTVLAAMIVAAAFLLGARNKSDDQWVLHSLELRGQLTRVLSLVQSAETGQRGYLLTGQDPYLGPYRMAFEQLPPMLDRLQDLASDEPQQLQSLGHLRNYHRGKTRRIEIDCRCIPGRATRPGLGHCQQRQRL